MRALRKTAPGVGNLAVAEVPEPTAGPGQVVLEVAYTGICGTDLHIYLDEYQCVPPVTLGHEVAGRVVQVGADVRGVAIGDRVVPETYFSVCGSCRHCASGRPNLCRERRSIGTHVDGGFAPYVVVPAHRLHAIPDGVAMRTAALTEPLACCVHALLDLATIAPRDTVVVSGPGPIGLLCLQIARAAGATTVLIGAPGDEGRLETGRRIGADHTMVAGGSIASAISDLTDGLGADLCVEAAGAAASLGQCLDLVRRGGTIVQVGLYGRPVQVDVNQIAMKELRVAGSFAHVPLAWDRALTLLATGAVQAEPLISGVASLEGWEEQFEALRAKRACKVLLEPRH